jgi:hypothetical protein
MTTMISRLVSSCKQSKKTRASKRKGSAEVTLHHRSHPSVSIELKTRIRAKLIRTFSLRRFIFLFFLLLFLMRVGVRKCVHFCGAPARTASAKREWTTRHAKKKKEER